MWSSDVYYLLVVFLVQQSASHVETDKRHGSLTFDPGKIFSTKLISTPKTRPHNYNRPRDEMEEIPSPLIDSATHVKFHPLLFQTNTRRQHRPNQRPKVQESNDVISPGANEEHIGTKRFERKEEDEFISGYEKPKELAKVPYLYRRKIDKGKREKMSSSSTPGRRPDDLSGDGKMREGLFTCGPNNDCVCTTRRVDCAHLGLTEFPENLPAGVQVIDASYNHITSISIIQLAIHNHLQEAYLSCNSITKLELFMANSVSSHLHVLKLDSNKLQDLDDVKFGALPTLRELDLSNNTITVIKEQLFEDLTRLKTLDLSYNNVKRIHKKAFDSLLKLSTLRLDNNKELGYSNSTFPERLFKHLHALTHLCIQGNANETEDTAYPNEALAHLVNLIELSIDGLAGGVEFGQQMEKLTRLHGLVFGFQGNCFIQNLSSTFFQHVPHLLRLTFVECPFNNIKNGAFEKLHNLANYTLAFPTSNYKFSDALDDLQGLPNPSLKNLGLIGFIKVKSKCRTLSSKDIKYISRFHHLHVLNLNFNYISNIEKGFIENIPKSLTTFYLRGNRFTFIDERWNLLMNFTNLYEIDIRDQNMYPSVAPENQWFGGELSRHRHPYIYEIDIRDQNMYPSVPPENQWFGGEISRHRHPYSHTVTQTTKGLKGEADINVNYVEREQSVCHDKRYEYCELKTESLDTISNLDNSPCDPYDSGRACIPPNLLVVRASGFTEFGRALLYYNRSKNILCYLDFSRGFFNDWGNGLLPTHVKIADFRDNLCDNVKPEFFPPKSQLRYLCMDNNYLGPAFSEDVNGTIFSRAQSLQYLSVAMNTIFKLPASFFQGLRSLETLDMHENKLQILDVDFSLTPNLRDIDLSKNSITWITRRSRRSLDALAVNHSVLINLLYNPLPCSCEGVEVLQWLANTRVGLKYKRYLRCNSDTQEKVLLGDIKKRIRSLNRKCIPISNLIIISSSVCAYVILSGLLYQYRWKLIYFRNIWIVKRCGFRPKGRSSSQHMYDAYVVYSEEDREFALNTMLQQLEVRRGHKLCLADRDFIPGNFNFNNITCAIQNSTITLLLLSPHFLGTREFEYAIQMALMEQNNGQGRRAGILVLRYSEISNEKLTKDLLTLMTEGRFLDYPEDQDESIKQMFWDNVSTEIGHTQNTNAPDLLLNTE